MIILMNQHPQPGPDVVDLAGPEASRVARSAFFRAAELWGLTAEEARVLLGSPGRSTFFGWKKGEGGVLSHDVLERISYVLGIYKGLQILFPDAQRADVWIRKPNDAFGGRSALDRMLAGNVADLYQVRAYVDYVRGGLS